MDDAVRDGYRGTSVLAHPALLCLFVCRLRSDIAVPFHLYRASALRPASSGSSSSMRRPAPSSTSSNNARVTVPILNNEPLDLWMLRKEVRIYETHNRRHHIIISIPRLLSAVPHCYTTLTSHICLFVFHLFVTSSPHFRSRKTSAYSRTPERSTQIKHSPSSLTSTSTSAWKNPALASTLHNHNYSKDLGEVAGHVQPTL